MAKQYLDATGLSHYDEKIKSYISSKTKYTAGNGIDISGSQIAISDTFTKDLNLKLANKQDAISTGTDLRVGNLYSNGTISSSTITSRYGGDLDINVASSGINLNANGVSVKIGQAPNKGLLIKDGCLSISPSSGSSIILYSSFNRWLAEDTILWGSMTLEEGLAATGTIKSDTALVAPCIKEADFYIQSAINDDGSAGTRYIFPRLSPVMGFGTGGGTGIVPVIGSLPEGASTGGMGLYIPNGYGAYDNDAYSIITAQYSAGSNNQIYKLPALGDTQEGFLLSEHNIVAGSNITITNDNNGNLTISGSGGGGGTSYTAGTNIVITGTTIATTASPTFATSVTTPLIKNDSSKITLLPSAIAISAPSGVGFSSRVSFSSGAYFYSGATFDYAKGITFQTGGRVMGTLTPNSGASGNPTIYLPSSGGTIALKSDVEAKVAGVSSIDGVSGAITLGSGLSMSDKVLYAVPSSLSLYKHIVSASAGSGWTYILISIDSNGGEYSDISEAIPGLVSVGLEGGAGEVAACVFDGSDFYGGGQIVSTSDLSLDGNINVVESI